MRQRERTVDAGPGKAAACILHLDVTSGPTTTIDATHP
jgi:hypothetical protein